MTRDEEKLLRFKQQRSKEAIDLAMQARWQEAVNVNKEIVKDFRQFVRWYTDSGIYYFNCYLVLIFFHFDKYLAVTCVINSITYQVNQYLLQPPA